MSFEIVGFFLCLALTVVALVATLIAGLRKQRRTHVFRALTTVALLVLTIVFAFMLSKVREFPPEEMAIHKIFSRTGAYMVVPVAFTGAMLWRGPGWRWAHRGCVAIFLLAVLGASGTGMWVLSLSTPVVVPN